MLSKHLIDVMFCVKKSRASVDKVTAHQLDLRVAKSEWMLAEVREINQKAQAFIKRKGLSWQALKN